MEPEAIIEEVQEDAAAEVAADVIQTVAVENAIVTSEVASVSDALAVHAEVSEERHEEILEGQAWLENQFPLLSLANQALQATLLSLQTTVTTQLSMIQETLTRNSSTDSIPSIPPMESPILEEAAIVVVEPESAVVESQEASTKTVQRRRRLI